ncbi:aquaporin-like protein [Hypoxylon sp. FL1284]|nr:aquaporin-like protein [Hypoxylon sp. FL1284]
MPKASHNGEHATPRGWVHPDYRKTNPWYDKEKTRPVFSLGGPLPRVARWAVRAPPPKSPEELAERGEVEHAPNPVFAEGQAGAAQGQGSPTRRTAAGVTHGDRHNDAGQPVFEYQPSQENAARRDRTDMSDTGKSVRSGANFAIDSEPLGKREHEDVEKGDKDSDEYFNRWAKIRKKYPEPLAEFLATGIAVFLGLGATLSVNLSATQDVKYGSYETSCWAWGFAWMFGIYLGGGVSGAHMNPAISITLSIFRGFPWRHCIVYIFVQILASIVAGALAYGVYRDTILHVDPTMTNTAKTFFSSPQEWVSLTSAVADQIVGSAITSIAVLALGDDANNPPGAGMHAFVLGLLVTTMKFTLGYNIGSALNPASDFGPRLIAWAVGYRGNELWGTGWWFYGPVASTLAGSLIGAVLYDGLIFLGSESPVNYKTKGRFLKQVRKMFCFVAPEEAPKNE